MARIKLKLGDNEIEVDSRDFYVDNSSLTEIIQNVSNLLHENQAKIVYENSSQETEQSEIPQSEIPQSEIPQSEQYGLEYLDDAEAFEPEFNEPKWINPNEIKTKLQILEKNGFFNSPRTVTETVQQLREYGWAASPLDVSKSLTKMASNREINKNLEENRTRYFLEPLTNY